MVGEDPESDDRPNEVFMIYNLGGKKEIVGQAGGVPIAFIVDTGADENIIS